MNELAPVLRRRADPACIGRQLPPGAPADEQGVEVPPRHVLRSQPVLAHQGELEVGHAGAVVAGARARAAQARRGHAGEDPADDRHAHHARQQRGAADGQRERAGQGEPQDDERGEDEQRGEQHQDLPGRGLAPLSAADARA